MTSAIATAQTAGTFDRATVQRRTIATLMLSQVCGGIGQVLGISVTALLGDALSGSKTLAGLAAACLSVGSTLTTFPLARLMARSGRRPGLRLGYLIGSVGASIALVAALSGTFLLLPMGVLLMGAAQAANLATRYAAADLAADDKRASTIGLLVWTSTFGSGFGSLISLSLLDPLGVRLGLPNYAGSYLAGIGLMLTAATVIHLRLRPDPLVLAGGVRQASTPRLPFTRSLGLILQHPRARVAVLAMMLSQATMVGTMTLTPIHMKDGGHSGTVISLMLFCHIMGMFALSPFVGSLADRLGRYPMLIVAGVLCTTGTLTAGFSPNDQWLGIIIGQTLVGLAWSFGVISASGLLTESFAVEQRASIQGAGDLCMSGCGALAGVSAGAIVAARSYLDLNIGAASFGLILIAIVVHAMHTLRRERGVPVVTG